jgi:hypothetical protein
MYVYLASQGRKDMLHLHVIISKGIAVYAKVWALLLEKGSEMKCYHACNTEH